MPISNLSIKAWITVLLALSALCSWCGPHKALAEQMVFDVTTFGAIGDGVQDDTKAIQKAIDEAAKAGGGVVYFPPAKAKYRVTANIAVRSNVTLTSSGNKTVVGLEKASLSIDGQRSIIIENLTLQGKERKSALIQTYSSQNPTDMGLIVRNCCFEGGKFGISSAHWIRNVTVENNHFTDCDYGLYVHTIDDWKIINNTFMRPIHRPIEIHNGHYNLVSGNTIEGDKKQTIIGILFMTNSSLPTDGPSNNIVANNRVRHIIEEGIMMEETVANAYVAGGTATSGSSRTLNMASAGWKAEKLNNREVLLVAGKGAGQWRKIASSTADTLTVDKDWTVQPDATTMFTVVKAIKGNVISGNIVEDTGRMGIELYGPSVDNIIEGNIIRYGGTDKGYSGIALVGTSGQGGNKTARHPAMNNLVADNIITGAELAGVQVYQVNYMTPDFFNINNSVIGNKVSDVQSGILVQRSRNTAINANTVSFVRMGILEEKESDYTLAVGNMIREYADKEIVLTGSHKVMGIVP